MKRYPLALAAVVGLVMLAAAAQCPAQTKSLDVESAIANSPTIKAIVDRMDRFEKNCVCQRAPGAITAGAAAAVDGCTCTVVHKADGTCVCRICENGKCREVPCTVQGAQGPFTQGVQTAPMLAAPGTVIMASGGGGFGNGSYGVVSYGSSGGGCENGQCGDSPPQGKRGLHLFKRKGR